MNRPPAIPPARQRGIVSIIAAVALLVMVGLALRIGLGMSGSGVIDSAVQNDSVEALFLAESAVERGARLFAAGGACTAAGLEAGTDFNLGRGRFRVLDTPAPALVSGNCRFQARGEITATGQSRIVEVVVAPGAIRLNGTPTVSKGNGSSLSWSHTVEAGANRLLIVGVSWRSDDGQTVSSVSYAGQPMTPVVDKSQPAAATGATRVTVQIFRLIDPPVGTANVNVTLSAATGVVGGALALSGVNQTTPIEATASNSDRSTTPNVSVMTLTGNAWVVDTVARFGAGTLTMTAATNRSEAWNTKITGKNQVGGAASYRGPISPPATVAMDWTWDANNHWAAAAVAVKPGGSGVINWREVVK